MYIVSFTQLLYTNIVKLHQYYIFCNFVTLLTSCVLVISMETNEVKAILSIGFERDQAQELSIPTSSRGEDSTLYKNLNNVFKRRYQSLEILADDEESLNIAIQEVNKMIDRNEVVITKESGSIVSNIRLI